VICFVFISFYVLYLFVCCATYVFCVASIIFVYVILIVPSLYFMDVSSISCAHICFLSSIFNKHNILSSNSSRFSFSCSLSRASLDHPFENVPRCRIDHMHASSCILLVWHSNTSVHTTTIIASFNMKEFSNYIIRRTGSLSSQ